MRPSVGWGVGPVLRVSRVRRHLHPDNAAGAAVAVDAAGAADAATVAVDASKLELRWMPLAGAPWGGHRELVLKPADHYPGQIYPKQN